MSSENREEEELAARQDSRLYPVGRALRSTFDAENHDSLDPTVTGLMLDLARVDPARLPTAPPMPSSCRSMPEPDRKPLLKRLMARLSRQSVAN